MLAKRILKASVLIMVMVFVANSLSGSDDIPIADVGNVKSVEAEYVPNEIIIKFRETAADTVAQELKAKEKPKDIKISTGLDELNRRHKLSELKPVIRNFKTYQERIRKLSTKDEGKLTKKERKILKRLKRAPKNARVPALDRIYKIKVEPETDKSLKDVVAEYNARSDVEYAELNYICSLLAMPDDPHYEVQWALNNTGQMYPSDNNPMYLLPPGDEDADIDAPEAWDIHTGDPDIVVAVLDSGVDLTHADLQGNLWTNETELNGVEEVDDDENGYIDDLYGYDFANNDNNPTDDHGHGTHCAGIIAAKGNNNLDITGICWDAKIMCLKMFNNGCSGSNAHGVETLMYAIENGADVISNSWKATESNSLEEVMQFAASQGVLVVAAAGNSNNSERKYPAAYEQVIAVAATNSKDERAGFSTYGSDWVDIAAPGRDILSLRARNTNAYADMVHYYPESDPGATMYVMSGTSMACPYVAGTCALLLSVNNTLTCDEIRDILIETVDLLPGDPWTISGGRLNVYTALLAAIPSAGVIHFNRNAYSCDDSVDMSLFDADLAGQGAEQVIITTSGGDAEVWGLNEQSEGNGVFEGAVPSSSSPVNIGDHILQVAHGDTITVMYMDSDDGTGNPAVVNDTATVDCQAPAIISDVEVAISGPEVIVSFETDELSFGTVWFGLDCQELAKTDSDWGTSHSITLRGVEPFETYYFVVEAADEAGNLVINDNSGQCYIFETDGPTTLYVPGDYPTIQGAVDNSSMWPGSIVWVDPGNYGPVTISNKPLTISGVDPDDQGVVESTIIDGQGAVTEAVLIESGEDEEYISRISGITIRNTGQNGVSCEASFSCTISNCVIEECNRGIYIQNPTTRVLGNIIRNNNDSAIYCMSAALTVKNNWIYNNNCGVKAIYSVRGIISNNTIANNTTGLTTNASNRINITNCIFYGNGQDLPNCTATYSFLQDSFAPEDPAYIGCISGDPGFVDALNSDFHLQTGSPCVNTGAPVGYYSDYVDEKDIDGQLRLMCELVDMGADELAYCTGSDCFPEELDEYQDWVDMGKPDCWCASPAGSGYQCDGDADGTTETYLKYRVYFNDYNLIFNNWKKKITDPTLDPCADIDHKPETFFKYRVYFNDINRVLTNWKKTDSDLPGNCPREE